MKSTTKLLILSCSLFLGSLPAFGRQCTEVKGTLEISAQEHPACQVLQGAYSLTTCDDGKGSFVGVDQVRRALFQNGTSWLAKRSISDFDSNDVVTEQLFIQDSSLSFQSETTTQGQQKSFLSCNGTLVKL